MDILDLTPYMFKIVQYPSEPHRIRVRVACAEGYAHELAHRLRMRNIRCYAKSRGTVDITRPDAVVAFLRVMDLPSQLAEAVLEYEALALRRVTPSERLDLEAVVRRIVAFSPQLENRPVRQRAPKRTRDSGL